MIARAKLYRLSRNPVENMSRPRMSKPRFFCLNVDIVEAPRKMLSMPAGTSQLMSGTAVNKTAPMLENAMKYRISGIFDLSK